VEGNSRDNESGGVLLPEKRRELIAERLRAVGSVQVATLEQEFGISSMTARRDLRLLEQAGRAERIHGGAVAPGPARREDPFRTRLGQAAAAKERLGAIAVELVADGETVFVDGSTTAYLAVRRLLATGRRMTVITNSVPVMDLVASSDVPNTTLIGITGTLRKATRTFVGSKLDGGGAHSLGNISELSIAVLDGPPPKAVRDFETSGVTVRVSEGAAA
jgi:DeoR/GlpR family transcriptional regulator of sugar metabolism